MNEIRENSENRIITSSTLLKIGDQYYQVEMLNEKIFTINDFQESTTESNLDGNELLSDVAYLIGDPYYYFYRGKISELKKDESSLPGIYFDDTKNEYLIQYPETDEEKDQYTYSDKITTYDADEIRNAVMNKTIVIFNVPDSAHSAIPPETLEDDILKKLIKRAITSKGIDLDQYKSRFASKNMLFNTKQVLRGNNRLSMLLFDRCADALNLKYTIILEEAGGEIIGHPLQKEIVISSSDTISSNLEDE